jgi:hypothetical protein
MFSPTFFEMFRHFLEKTFNVFSIIPSSSSRRSADGGIPVLGELAREAAMIRELTSWTATRDQRGGGGRVELEWTRRSMGCSQQGAAAKRAGC